MSKLTKILQVKSDNTICELINQHDVSKLMLELDISPEKFQFQKLQDHCLLTNCEPCSFDGVIASINKLENE
ncbi:hypothetical protein CGI15_21415 [Vibrio parahaemolyticus]|nr:hypothetical protein CGI64_20355 [Vibrio parahaemolyticus]TOK53542.1 hypothetical protein CGI15_21415 [Vibrio parahaemolyticus]